MNYAIILAAGVGQRMRNGGLPKQFLKLMGKPIIIYTLEKFEECEEINKVMVVCHGSYIDYMQNLLSMYQLRKTERVIVGGSNRQSSVQRGLNTIMEKGGGPEDIVVVHDGVRPLVELSTIRENIRIAKQYGCAVTVHSVTESVVITQSEEADMENFKKRADTWSMTSPQTFQLGKIAEAYRKIDKMEQDGMPLLDAAMVYAQTGGKVHLVKEHGANIKITTPEDYYFLKAMLELEENKCVFGL
ncbi:IspD/TarI family cytidylyltransferase [Parablautia intestinalis]|uniref:IspD/TarI family cytidylyltransferase n=1 Tax=Parablautia intestinalis TaxID=2320100 RepID=UPI002412BEE8|nr:IspD/TarI family cytidylyltransferase [Parablautia intestinalis]